uniref:Uncharacterized protein n=1 Tax=Plectus sambesii TaxID=2011161 RepID=A0A914UXX3_9BILA
MGRMKRQREKRWPGRTAELVVKWVNGIATFEAGVGGDRPEHRNGYSVRPLRPPACGGRDGQTSRIKAKVVPTDTRRSLTDILQMDRPKQKRQGTDFTCDNKYVSVGRLKTDLSPIENFDGASSRFQPIRSDGPSV